MAFWTNIGITCLAELVKWSNPWHLWNKLVNVFTLLWPPLLFVGTMTICVVMYPSEDDATYRTLTFEEIWATLTPEPSATPEATSLLHAPIPTPHRMEVPLPQMVEYHFPLPEELKPQVTFWKNVFARYHSHQLVVYDALYVQLVYTVIDRKKKPASSSATIESYRNILRSLAKKTAGKTVQALTAEEARVYKLFEGISEKDKFNNAASREIRVISGQREHFIEAFRVSGLYHQRFLQIFHEHGVPLELTWLPFVESYYKYQAYSSAAAAGVWQFIPSTARLYGLQMTSAIDERYDPFKSAESAAELLKANYELFQSWPLAITAYNHGPAGMINAIKQVGTNDFGKIATRYRSSSFGFYSRNYYAQFLAVVQVMREADTLFGEVERLPALQYEETTLDRRLYVKDLTTLLGLSEDQICALNRDLKSSVVRSKTPLPVNFVLKLPPGKSRELQTKLQTQTLAEAKKSSKK